MTNFCYIIIDLYSSIQIINIIFQEFLLNNSNTYFLFMNTDRFHYHPKIIYLDPTLDPIEKTKFINTCDAMIHARSNGETFGLAIAEFSLKNKPVITCYRQTVRWHNPNRSVDWVDWLPPSRHPLPTCLDRHEKKI